jgi:hypothetical protein
MSRSKKIIGGAALITAAIVVRTIVRIWRARRQPPAEASGPIRPGEAVSTAPGAYFPEGGPGTLQNGEGAPARSDLGEPDLGPPNAQPAPGSDTNPV